MFPHNVDEFLFNTYIDSVLLVDSLNIREEVKIPKQFEDKLVFMLRTIIRAFGRALDNVSKWDNISVFEQLIIFGQNLGSHIDMLLFSGNKTIICKLFGEMVTDLSLPVSKKILDIVENHHKKTYFIETSPVNIWIYENKLIGYVTEKIIEETTKQIINIIYECMINTISSLLEERSIGNDYQMLSRSIVRKSLVPLIGFHFQSMLVTTQTDKISAIIAEN